MVACFFAGSTVDYAMIENGMINMTSFVKVLFMYFPIGFFLLLFLCHNLNLIRQKIVMMKKRKLNLKINTNDSIEDTVNDDVKENNYIMGNNCRW